MTDTKKEQKWGKKSPQHFWHYLLHCSAHSSIQVSQNSLKAALSGQICPSCIGDRSPSCITKLKSTRHIQMKKSCAFFLQQYFTRHQILFEVFICFSRILFIIKYYNSAFQLTRLGKWRSWRLFPIITTNA